MSAASTACNSLNDCGSGHWVSNYLWLANCFQVLHDLDEKGREIA